MTEPVSQPIFFVVDEDPSAVEVLAGDLERRFRADVTGAANPGDVIGYLREHEITLTWNPPPPPCRRVAPRPPRPSP